MNTDASLVGITRYNMHLGDNIDSRTPPLVFWLIEEAFVIARNKYAGYEKPAAEWWKPSPRTASPGSKGTLDLAAANQDISPAFER